MRKKVLVIDDDEGIQEVLQFVLEEAGFDILTTARFDRNAIEEDMPDIIFLDISIAGVDGKQVSKQLKNSEKTKHIPIIILSAYSQQEVSQFAKDASADGYLLKPFDIHELQTVITRHVKKPHG